MEQGLFEGKQSCVFTGHRPQGLPMGGDEAAAEMAVLKQRLLISVEQAVRCGVETFYAGGAMGFDMLAAETVITLRDWFPRLILNLALPSRTQSERYPPEQRQRYQRLMMFADGVWYASQADNSVVSMSMRNRYMVEHADCCIAFLSSASGGTFQTVRYARKRGLPVLNLADGKLEQTTPLDLVGPDKPADPGTLG